MNFKTPRILTAVGGRGSFVLFFKEKLYFSQSILNSIANQRSDPKHGRRSSGLLD